jgi:tetratricopeptide (TPR) repeat protein
MAVLKKSGEDRPPSTRKRRLWTIAPAPSLPARPFDGCEIIEELPTPVGLALFDWARAVHLWAHAEGATAGLFGEAVIRDRIPGWALQALEDPIREACGAFERLILHPESIRSQDLVRVCLAIAEWATEEGFGGTAALYHEAACWASPDDPELAFRAGRANRRNVAYDRAVLWFQRGRGLARRSGHRTAYVDCLLGWGNLEIARGRFEAGRRRLVQAFRAARRFNLPELGAAAQHDLFMLSVDERKFREAYRHASAALAMYSPSDAGFPFLVHDLAQTWALEGYGEIALPVLQAVRPFIQAPSGQVQIVGNIAGAAGLAGDIETFFAAWDEVSRYAGRPAPFVAAALAPIAEGAFALRLNRQAVDAATRALRIAQQREEPIEERRARELLERVRSGGPPQQSPRPPDEIKTLATLLLSTLAERTDQR